MKRTIGVVQAALLLAIGLQSVQAQLLLTGPNNLLFTTTTGGATPPSQTVLIRHTGDTARTLAISVSTSVGGNWLAASLNTNVTPAKLTVSVLPAGLSVGSYSGSVLISSNTVSPARVDVTLNVVSAAQLTTLPTTLSFFRQLGADPPADEQLVFVNSTGSPANTNLMVTTTDGGSWLVASAVSNVTPGVISVRINSSGLGAGTFNGSLAISSAGLNPVNVPVSLVVSASPFVTANPPSISLAALRNGSAITQSVAIQASSGIVPFVVNTSTTSGGNWLIVTPLNGAAPGNLDVSANPAGLPNGVYQGTIQLTATGASNPSVQIPVSLTVTDSPVVTASPRTLSLSVALDPTQTSIVRELPAITVSSTTANASFTVSTTTSNGGAWLVAGPSLGSAPPGTVTALVDATGLPSGSYNGSIVITGPGNTVVIPVSLVVTSNAQLVVDPPSITFNLQKNQTPPSNQVVNVTSTGASFNFQSAVTSITPAGGTWLTVGATTGTTPAPLTFGITTAAATALPNGQYNATVTFSGQSGINPAPPTSPTLNVVLNVSDTPLFNLSPATLDFVVPVNGPAPAARNISVTTTDNSSKAFTALASTTSGGTWLLVGPNSGNTPSNLNVQLLPVGLGAGIYEGSIQVTVPSISATPQSVRVRLIVQPVNVLTAAPTSLTFTQASGGAPAAPKTIALTSTGAANYQITTSTTAGGAWLSVSPAGGSSPGTLTVSVNGGNLAPGNYGGSIGVTSLDVNNSPFVIPVLLTVTAPTLSVNPPSVSLLAAPGSTQAVTQQLAVSAGTAAFTAAATTNTGGNWLSVSPTTGTSPANVTVSANPTGLAAGSYTGTITFTSAGLNNSPLAVQVTFNVATAPPPGRQLFSQIADGSNWKTTITLVNLDTDPAPFTLRFYSSDGTVLRLPIDGNPGRLESLEGTIPVGGSRTIQTSGTDTALSQGWAELTSTKLVSGIGVFRQRATGRADQEAGVSATTPSSHFVLPFDNTQGFVSSMALVNTNGSLSRAVAVTPRDETGNVLAGDSVNLPARGHLAFVMSERFPSMASRRGSADFTSPAGDFSAVGLRFNPGGSFTSLPTLDVPLSADQRPANQIISQIADGSNWKTTVTLVNLDTVPAPFTIRFWRQNGTSLSIPLAGGGSFDSIDGTIPVGGTRIIESLGGTTDLVQGWAELVTTRLIGGLAVFRQRDPARNDQEAAVTLTATSNRFVLAFDNTENFVTSMALVNVSATLGATVSVIIRDEAGQQIGSDTVALSGRGQTAFALPDRFTATRNRRGTVEFSSAGTQITGLGLRFNPSGSYTSFPVFPKR